MRFNINFFKNNSNNLGSIVGDVIFYGIFSNNFLEEY